MPTVVVRCECGERFKSTTAQEAAGGIICPRCNRRLKVRHVRKGGSTPRGYTSPDFDFTSIRARLALALASLRSSRRGGRAGSWQHPVVLLCWAYAVFAVLLAAGLWTLGDRWWLATIVLFIGRWIFLLPLVVLVPAAIVTRPKLLLPLSAAAVVIVGPVMGARAGLESWMPAPDGPRVRVMSYNSDDGPQPAVDLQALLDKWEPDIVAFQECGALMAEAILELSGWHHHRARGLCLVTRFPIRDSAVMDRSALELIKEHSGGIGGSGDVARYTLESPAGPINFTNLHLETPRKGFENFFTGAGGAIVRLRQNTILRDAESRLARRHVDAGGAPAIVAGDFNTPVESVIFRRHWGSLKDAHSRAGFGLGMTKHNGWIRIRIDHVLTDASWRIVSANVGSDKGSSHFPLVVDLVLTGK